ncbi:cyclopropane-fatty-acyl-phospholipid synthase [Dendrobium catenatum]|uniref:Cyclopropane-fatty-acyl-phospholipid synthase n=1 Tax=Dendrobium catenatum TaxID=906689 RepID=A0A2I0X2A2_9ASPA|nr:cyclopropane-fatty-acyl-phospholipid synthase [Dendrobium catenatum]
MVSRRLSSSVNAGAEVVIYEKEDYLVGHASTVAVDGVDLDIGFMVFNRLLVVLVANWRVLRVVCWRVVV